MRYVTSLKESANEYTKPAGHDIGARPDSLIARNDYLEQVMEAIQMLPEEQCEYLALYAIDELEIAEIAERSGKTTEYVDKIIKRAKRRIRR